MLSIFLAQACGVPAQPESLLLWTKSSCKLRNRTTFPTMLPVTPPTSHLALLNCPTSASNASISYKIRVSSEISEDTLKLCADLFSSHYSIWGDQASTISKYTIVAGQQSECGSSAI